MCERGNNLPTTMQPPPTFQQQPITYALRSSRLQLRPTGDTFSMPLRNSMKVPRFWGISSSLKYAFGIGGNNSSQRTTIGNNNNNRSTCAPATISHRNPFVSLKKDTRSTTATAATTRTHAQTHTRAYAHAHTRTRAPTHMHTHKRTYA